MRQREGVVISKTENLRGGEWYLLVMVIHMKGNFAMIKKKDMAHIILKMEKYLKVIFSKIISKVKEL